MFTIPGSILRTIVFVVTLAMAVFGNVRDADSVIRGMDAEDGRLAVITSDQLLLSDNNGTTWELAGGQLGLSESFAGIHIGSNGTISATIVNTRLVSVSLAQSIDGGLSWTRTAVDVPYEYLSRADLTNVRLSENGDLLTVSLRLESSSSFSLWYRLVSSDGGSSWAASGISETEPGDARSTGRGFPSLADPNESIVTEKFTHDGDRFFVTQTGRCFGRKTGCYQEYRVRRTGLTDITPPLVKELSERIRSEAKNEADQQRMFALPPGGTTRISLNRGFDKCQAGSVAQMQLWWDNSPLYDSNIYFSGRNRACASQPLNTTWIDQVTAMGWGLIPTVVGYQSPCTAGTTTVKLSYDPAAAETQGRGEADIAVTDAANIGLTTGSILYYDMERYDPPTPDTLGCRTATVAFLKGWTERIRELGYKSGVYGSPKNAQEDWALMPPASKMDAIWMARWDNNQSVWVYASFPTFPTTEWADHQRIKQWQAPHNETWGGVTFNIDGNNADGPVAGLAIARNRDADYDGDGKTDVSVFRPDNGIWYVQNSGNASVGAVQFGVATDSIMPRDYDGDGRTDQGVFRSADGVWYTLTKAGVFSARQFGLPGDIPAAADYNGDGKADIAVYRPANGYWYIANSDSNGTYTFINFGLAGDIPVPGDFDGDGKADLVVFRPSNGIWYMQRSTAGGYAIQFGNSSDKLVPADYDGDGKMDVGIYRPSQGTWYSYNSSNGSYPVTVFGLSTDIPTPGDYDGDGKADIAIFRPSNGQWWLNRTTSGLTVVQFGSNGDKPTQNAFGN